MPLEGGGDDSHNAASLAAIRVSNVASADVDRLSMVSQDSRKILGNPWVFEMAPFFS